MIILATKLWDKKKLLFCRVAANLVEAETVEIGTASGSRPARSNPVNMPHAASRPLVPVVIDGSGSKQFYFNTLFIISEQLLNI